MKSKQKQSILKSEFEDSKGNVFTDLGLENSDQLLAKSTLIIAIRRALEARGLSEADAAQLLTVYRRDFASALRGDLDRYSLDELDAYRRSMENVDESL